MFVGLSVWLASLYLPGMLLARGFGWRCPLPLIFAISCTIVYLVGLGCLLVLQQFTVGLVGGVLVVICLVAAAVTHYARPEPPPQPRPVPPQPMPWWLIIGAIATAALFLWKTWHCPLSGADTPFRWNLLSQLIVHRQNLAFYPPNRIPDFSLYFFPDSIAPWVAIQYAWLYVCLGAVNPKATTLLLLLIYSAIVVACSQAEPAKGPSAPRLVAGLLLLTPWLFWGVAIGQETGWLAFGTAATALAWRCARGEKRWIAAIPAALAIQAAVNAREYGPAFIVVGLALGLMQTATWTQLALFAVMSTAGAIPWLLHAWGKQGVSLGFLWSAFETPQRALVRNYMDFIQDHYAIWHQSGRTLLSIGWFWAKGGLAILLAVVALQFRPAKRTAAWPLVAAVSLVLALWLWSIGFISGGYVHAVRVACPAWILLALACHRWGDDLSEKIASSFSLSVGVVAAILLSALIGMSAPFTPQMLGWAGWITRAFESAPQPPIVNPAVLARVPSSYVLTDNAYQHAADLQSGAEPRSLPPWTPELCFLYDGNATPAEAAAQLSRLHVTNRGALNFSPAAKLWQRHPLLVQSFPEEH